MAHIIYTWTATLLLLKITGELDWSWWSIFIVLIIYEGLGFINGFLRGFIKEHDTTNKF
jgi:hypothetical protein